MLPQRVRLLLNCTSNAQGLGLSCWAAREKLASVLLKLFFPYSNILNLPLSFRHQQASSGVYTTGVTGTTKVGLEGDCGTIDEGSTTLHLHMPDYLSVLYPVLCDVETQMPELCSPLPVLDTFPCLSLLSLGSDYPPFFLFNDPCSPCSHFLSSPLASFPFSQCGVDPRGTGRRMWLARGSCG